MQSLQFLGERRERNIDTRHADHLAIRHDGIGKRGHGGRHFRAFGEIRLGNRSLAGLGGQRIPLRCVIVLEGRELDIALLGLGPVRREGAGRVGAEIEPVGDLCRLTIEKAELFAEPAAECKSILLHIGLEDVDDARAIHRLRLMRPTDDASH